MPGNCTRVVIDTLERRRLFAAGDLDLAFGSAGKVTDQSIGSFHAPGVVVRDDGRIVVVGTNDRIARYTADGALDPTFGAGGYVQLAAGTTGGMESAAAAPGGKFVIGSVVRGSGPLPDSDFHVARFNADGTPDTTFAAGAGARVDFAGRMDELVELAVQPDGKVVAIGRARTSAGAHFAVVRLNTDGSLDPTFGTGGKVTTALPETTGSSAGGVVLQPDGKIVVVGAATKVTAQDVAVVRYNADGTVDALQITDLGATDDAASDVALLPDGRIIAVGRSNGSAALARYSAGLAFERSAVTPNPRGAGWARAVRVDAAGRIVVAGRGGSDVMLARYNADLSRDLTFGANGWVATDFGSATAPDQADRLFVLPGNKLLAAGQRTDNGRFIMARYDAGPLPPAVVGRHVFYNRSASDGNDARANAADDAAVDHSKSALFPGQRASFANVTGYGRGINGVMLDMATLPRTPVAADFVFETGTVADGAPTQWRTAPAPTTIARRPGAGADGTDRVTLVWPDAAIRNTWLRVTVKANGNTGLRAADVFCFGNLVGETGDDNARLAVTARDVALMRRALAGGSGASAAGSGAVVFNRCDHNRDGVVDVRDLLVVRRAQAAGAVLDEPQV